MSLYDPLGQNIGLSAARRRQHQVPTLGNFYHRLL